VIENWIATDSGSKNVLEIEIEIAKDTRNAMGIETVETGTWTIASPEPSLLLPLVQ
jgi:hypothetical protein